MMRCGLVYSGAENSRENRSTPVGTLIRVAWEMCLSIRLRASGCGLYSTSRFRKERRERETCGTLCTPPSIIAGLMAVTPDVPPK